ncbi:hypothetical protein BU16DRAFT_464366 [Lophium mytilinum]|uniref:Rhodopsin domain-containing protein n=1 Tax=Lophium mytilinum TaxID=390894 RepID=A0A6A6QMY8_9PEZI|nr:hypothetical protein BU16DRAFT_464366 [Lophium mytilinum]
MGTHLRAIPTSATAQWPAPNYTNPERRTWFPVFGLILQVVATLLFATRLLSNLLRRGGSPSIDDAFISIAWLFGTLFTALCVLGTLRLGFDRHIWDSDPNSFSDSALWVIWVAIGFTAAYTLTFLFVLVLMCRPTEAFWKSFDPVYSKAYQCSSSHVTNPWVGALGAVSDFYTVLLSAILVWNMQMQRRERIGLNVILALAVS